MTSSLTKKEIEAMRQVRDRLHDGIMEMMGPIVETAAENDLDFDLALFAASHIAVSFAASMAVEIDVSRQMFLDMCKSEFDKHAEEHASELVK